jgi:hypothetical protein
MLSSAGSPAGRPQPPNALSPDVAFWLRLRFVTAPAWPGRADLPRDLTSTKAARLMSNTVRRFWKQVQLHAAASALVDDLEDAAEEILRLTEKIRFADRQLKVLTAEI